MKQIPFNFIVIILVIIIILIIADTYIPYYLQGINLSTLIYFELIEYRQQPYEILLLFLWYR